ncbi:NAD(P)H-dependent oxidoreductase [Solitalea sp. MAHUQ-68]|uniref:NAD(P)H-dependent oxidoreductase n=1 Tax=Solitalea agri TaxID=2953739 RepID=A0A9X2EZ46_9SPHI|nr:NADPH-dependent FMN reductase [Solitalea agri]MCO4291707.1 NAD(P)H-dependent oxidoreductase [Solitalea agri]
MQIAIISGSARPDRQSHKVALEIESRIKKSVGITTQLLDVKEYQLPLLDYTYRTHPAPSEKMTLFHDHLLQSQGILVVSPEHNSSFAGALKNTMDYYLDEYSKKPFGIAVVSAGMLGGINAARELQHYCIRLNGIVSPSFLITPKVQTLFDQDGNLIDESYGERIEKFLDEYLWLFNKLNN